MQCYIALSNIDFIVGKGDCVRSLIKVTIPVLEVLRPKTIDLLVFYSADSSKMDPTKIKYSIL